MMFHSKVIRIFLLFYMASATITHVEKNNQISIFCPVSSHSDFSIEGSFLYPLQIYDEANALLNSTDSKLVVKCTDSDLSGKEARLKDKKELKPNYLCPRNLTFCPIHPSNLHANLNGSKLWQKSTSFCALKDHLSNKSEIVNVIILGNSVTAGVMAQGCCDKPECQYIFHSPDYHQKTKMCAWSRYFNKWIKASSQAIINVFNLAIGGYRSYATANDLHSMLSDISIRELTSRDILFLDHAVTDASILQTDEQHAPQLIESGVRELIMKIYSYCKDKTQLPTVILLENEGRDVKNYEIMSNLYTKVAKQFHINYWSYRDAVRLGNIHDINDPDYKWYTHLLEFDGVKRWEIHPAWHVQLYYADLLAASLVHELSLCSNTHYNVHSRQSVNDTAYKMLLGSHSSGLLVPNYEAKPLLDITYDAVMAHKNTIIGSWFSGTGAWQLTTDVKGKGGFIRQLSATDPIDWYDDATITFNLDTTHNNHFNNHSDSTQYLLSLTYLASYTNVGVVDIYLCGHFVTHIDAMWSDPNNHISLPEIRNILVDKTLCTNTSQQATAIKYKRSLGTSYSDHVSMDIRNVSGSRKLSGQQLSRELLIPKAISKIVVPPKLHTTQLHPPLPHTTQHTPQQTHHTVPSAKPIVTPAAVKQQQTVKTPAVTKQYSPCQHTARCIYCRN